MEKYEKITQITHDNINKTSSINQVFSYIPVSQLIHLSIADLMALLTYLLNEEDLTEITENNSEIQFEELRDQITLIQQEIENRRNLIFR